MAFVYICLLLGNVVHATWTCVAENMPEHGNAFEKKDRHQFFEMETLERKRNIRPAVFTYFLTHLQIYTRTQKKSNVIFEANIFARLNASTLA